MKGQGPSRLTIRRLAWAAVLAANLPIPLYLGYLCTEGGGRVGMLAGVGLIWLLGHESCRRQPKLASVVIPGGWFVALTQLFPILQFFSGAFALRVVSLGLAREGMPRAGGDLAAFTATLLTGGMLLTVTLIPGFLFRAIVPDDEWPRDFRKPKVDRDELA